MAITRLCLTPTRRTARSTARRWGFFFIGALAATLLAPPASGQMNPSPSGPVFPPPPGAHNPAPPTPLPQPAPVPFSNPANATATHTAPAAPVAVFLHPEGDPDALAEHLLVVYNTNDPDSKALADYYASRRNISADRVLGLPCPLTEEINRAQFEKTLRQPILDYLYQKSWIARRNANIFINGRAVPIFAADFNDIWAIVLMRGIPLKIAHDPTNHDLMEDDPHLATNAAAVDSELALLPVTGLPIGGYVPNPFYDATLSGKVRAGPELATRIILVTRLDGPTPADVRRMIDDCLWAEQNRLAGLAVIDTRGITDVNNPYTLGDSWLRSARAMLASDGWTIEFDEKPETLPATDPCNHVAFYLGWYSGSANGPWITPPNRFEPGAIAYHLHSFSAATVRSATNCWVGPLIAHGADATMGCVYEPYLGLTPRVNIFTKRLLMGQTFAEAAYASQKGLSWMVTVVGDPLYRPFGRSIESVLSQAGGHRSPHNDWLYLQFIRQAILAHQITPDAATLMAHLAVPGASAVAYEGLGDLLDAQNDPASAAAAGKAYQKAMALDTLPVDRIRVGLKLAQHDINHSDDDEAQAVLRQLRETYPDDSVRFGVPDQLVPTSAQAP